MLFVQNCGCTIHKQNQTKVDIDTWPITEIAVTTKPSKTKLQAGQEKFRQSKSNKPRS